MGDEARDALNADDEYILDSLSKLTKDQKIELANLVTKLLSEPKLASAALLGAS
jgi:glycine cleavage system regulatory protein